MRRLIVAAIAVMMAVTLVAPVGAVSPNAGGQRDSYIVIMAADPLVRSEGADNLSTPKAKARGAELRASHDKALRGAGLSPSDKINEYTVALNGFSALLTPAEVTSVEKQQGVAFALKDQLRQKTTDSSPQFMGLTGPSSAWSTGVTGEGVVVGIIDSGIWPEHPSFADNGYAPLPGYAGLPCEFGNTAANPADAPFTCNDKLLGARQMLETYRALTGADPDEYDSARDDDGHGTHTASTTAGNAGVTAVMYGRPVGTISGVAPRARVIAYKGLGNLGGYTSDLAAAIDQAVEDGVDVINYSVGGGPSLTGADDLAFLFAADAGVFVASSAGNSGSGAGTIGGPATVPWLTTVGASTQKRFFQGTIRLGNGASYSGASLTLGVGTSPLIDAASAGGDLCFSGTLDPTKVAGKIVLCRRGGNARADKSLAVYEAGGVGMIMYENTNTNNLFTDTHWVPSVHVDNTPGLAIKAYIASAGASATATITATGSVAQWPYGPSMTLFSSRGPNPIAGDIIKPDVTAPGIQILAGGSPTPDPGTTPPGELFQAIAGTSMSSPHVAGLFALLKQAHPDWSAAAARSALMTTAYQGVLDNDRVSPAEPFDMGAGHVNPGGAVRKGSAFQPGLVYDAGFYDYLGFLCDAGPEVFANPAATCGTLESIGIPTEARNLNYPSIGVARVVGSETISRTVTSVAQENGNRTYRASVVAPAGYTVTVSPSTLTLRNGQSATFEVMITNVSAPVGAWRFGSLTWSDTTGNYKARSPIAVNAAEFGAPASITGSGEAGTASFDVKFGYSGSYTAAAHGLEPATVTSDNVVQDPDQTFDPDDGFSNQHDFTLSGAAFFRVAIPPEATEADADLDIYVYDPDGEQVASSTKGGTDELVDILLPKDGTWSVFVHGWAAPGGDSDYDMYGWAVSATPGGNLKVDSAPSAASLGATGTVAVSWTGATAGEWHLGAVSHTGPGGLLGLTLVEVDNR